MREICSCGAQMFWVKSETTGKPAPIDPVPNAEGPITLNTGTDGHEIVSYHVLTKAERAALAEPQHYDTPRYTNHFQTCPQAKTYRKRGPR